MPKNTRSPIKQALDGTLPVATLTTTELELLMLELENAGHELRGEQACYPKRWVTRVLKAAAAARWVIGAELHARSRGTR